MAILYTVLSHSPSASTSHSPPVARGDSPCPRLACPQSVVLKRERKERKSDKVTADSLHRNGNGKRNFPSLPDFPSSSVLSSSSSSSSSRLMKPGLRFLSGSDGTPRGPTLLLTFAVRKKSRLLFLGQASCLLERFANRVMPYDASLLIHGTPPPLAPPHGRYPE